MTETQRIQIDETLCVGCAYCKLNCPVEAIEVRDTLAHVGEACTACGLCVTVCPVEAIKLAGEA